MKHTKSTLRTSIAAGALLAALSTFQTAQAASQTWDGGASTNELTTGTNWTNNAVPASNNDTATFDGTQAGALSLVMSASFGPTSGNSGGLHLSLAATQTDSVMIDGNGGTLGLGNITIASGAGAFTLGDGSGTTNITLRAASSDVFTNNSANTATIGGDVAIGNGNAIVGRNMTFTGNGDWIMSGTYASGGGFVSLTTATLTKSGTGTMTLTSSLGHGGTTTVSAGTLKIQGALTASAVNVTGTAAVSLENAGAVNRLLTLNNTSTLAQTVDNAISGGTASGLNVQTSGVTTTVSRPNNYIGQTTIGSNGGATVLRASASGAFGSGSVFIPGNGGSNRLELVNDITLGNALAVNGRGATPNQPAGILNVSGSNTLNGTVAVNTGGTYTTIQSDAGELTMAASTALTSAATGIRGVLFTGDGDIAVSGAITNGSSSGLEIYKSGNGTLTLSNANTYTGATSVSGGTFSIATGGSLTSNVTVNSGGAIGGDGTVTGNLSLSAGGKFVFSLTDTLSVNGASVSFGGFSIADLDGLTNAVADGTYTLIDGSATIDFTNVSNVGMGSAYDLGSGKSAYFQSGSLEVVVLPEPATFAMLLGGIGMLALRRRRRR